MYSSLKEIYNKFNWLYSDAYVYEYIEPYIVQLFNGKLEKLDEIDTDKLFWNGCYYQHVKKDYDKMKTYYLMAIDRGNDAAMCNLGYYYKNVEKDYDKMKTYYLMAIEHGNAVAMDNLGYYYQTEEKDYDKMKTYYLMAIEHDDSNVIDRCEQNHYFYCNKIKEAIITRPFIVCKKANKIVCPILLEETDEHYTSKLCGHTFSAEVLKVDRCPLCRTEFRNLTKS